ncbi:T9SS type A sorting domain-containing protein [Polaribacter sp. R77954]|uniref:T9SS type A sorting domain-containing protein n=1 Tax=Polaribacter sp. R77954 TaxID=3093870 RepID=UPI0037CA394F
MGEFLQKQKLKILLCVFLLSTGINHLSASNKSYNNDQPTTNAPTPPERKALDIISIFSDAYDNITGANYNPDWQQSGLTTANTDFQPLGSGNSVLAYTNFNYQGIEFNSVQDLTAMEYLHLDIWTVDGVIPSITVISSGAEIPHTLENSDGKWQSFEIPVAGITGDITKAIQLKFTGGTGFSTAIYLDNIYFYKNPTASGKDATLNALEVDGTSIDDFSPNTETYLMALPGGTTQIPQITLATPTDNSASTVITQSTSIPGNATVLVTSQDGSTTKTYTVSYHIGAPNTNAPTPPAREPLDVISIFSDAYDNITGANYNPYWQQNGYSSADTNFQPTGSGNAVLAYTNFNYQGIEFNSVQDLTSMEFLHLDIWTVFGVTPSITVISSGAEIAHSISNGDGEWQSIEIPVAGITGDIRKAIQLKFTGGNGFTTEIYLDNIYFYKKPTSTGKDATLSAFEIDGTSVEGFSPNSEFYEMALPGGTTQVPQITLATTTDAAATKVITQAPSIPGDATVVVTSKDGSTTKTYKVSYFIGAPHINAPTPPTRNSLDVISIFSDAYNNISGVNYNPDWQQVGFTSANTNFQPTGSGNAVLAYTNFTYQGIELNSVQDLTGMEFLHLDIWTVKEVVPTVAVLSSGSEIAHSMTNGDGKWQSIDIPVAGITGDITRAVHLMFNGGNGSPSAIYVDNIYFYKNPTAAAKDATLSALQVNGASVSGFKQNSESYLMPLPGGTTQVPQVTLATTTDAAATRVITQATAIPGDATVVVTSKDGTNTKTYKISFFIGAPHIDAPVPPTRQNSDVLSIFSDSYINISGANYNPYWQQSGYNSANIAFQPTGSGNEVLAYTNFNHQGIEFNSIQDLTGMEFLHIDVWTVNELIPSVVVISSGTEIAHAIPNGDGKWQSIDIPVEGITEDITKAIHLKFTGGDGFSNDIYLDNLYFWKAPSLGVKNLEILNLKVFPNPSQNSWTIQTDVDSITSVKVFDVQGKNVFSSTPNNKVTVIDGSNLKIGFYYAQVKTLSGVQTMKLIKK